MIYVGLLSLTQNIHLSDNQYHEVCCVHYKLNNIYWRKQGFNIFGTVQEQFNEHRSNTLESHAQYITSYHMSVLNKELLSN